jgi:two-component system, OmpR family, KDP operon response regulator KdpE
MDRSSDSPTRVLVVDDDRAFVGVLAMTLASVDCEVHIAYDGGTALRRYADSQPDAVILDLGLPDLSGEEVCRGIRASGATPILVLSGRKEEKEIARLLDAGADDYLTKPFGSSELLARVRALLRRAAPAQRRRIVVDGLVVDVAGHQATANGSTLELTPIEFRLLERLASREGELVPHGDLLAAGWPDGRRADPQSLRPHLARLRRKLVRGGAPDLKSVRGLGYRLSTLGKRSVTGGREAEMRAVPAGR